MLAHFKIQYSFSMLFQVPTQNKSSDGKIELFSSENLYTLTYACVYHLPKSKPFFPQNKKKV
jgi:hypothetical protein